MKRNFETMLATADSAAQKTLIDAMLEWGMASGYNNAVAQIECHPGEDLAGIKQSVISGLTTLAELIYVDVEELISEELNLDMASYKMIVKALETIHVKWIEQNFTPKRWAEKFFKGQLFQYRKLSKLKWFEVKKDLLFIKRYLEAGNYALSISAVESCFMEFAKYDSEDDDLEPIANKAKTFASEIIPCIIAYKNKLDCVKNAEIIDQINAFLRDHTSGNEIMEIMIKACK